MLILKIVFKWKKDKTKDAVVQINICTKSNMFDICVSSDWLGLPQELPPPPFKISTILFSELHTGLPPPPHFS